VITGSGLFGKYQRVIYILNGPRASVLRIDLEMCYSDGETEGYCGVLEVALKFKFKFEDSYCELAYLRDGYALGCEFLVGAWWYVRANCPSRFVASIKRAAVRAYSFLLRGRLRVKVLERHSVLKRRWKANELQFTAHRNDAG